MTAWSLSGLSICLPRLFREQKLPAGTKVPWAGLDQDVVGKWNRADQPFPIHSLSFQQGTEAAKHGHRAALAGSAATHTKNKTIECLTVNASLLPRRPWPACRPRAQPFGRTHGGAGGDAAEAPVAARRCAPPFTEARRVCVPTARGRIFSAPAGGPQHRTVHSP